LLLPGWVCYGVYTGSFQTTTTFGSGEAGETTLTSAGDHDIFLARYNSAGTLVWAKRAGGTGFDIGESIAVLPGESALVTGYFSSNATFFAGEANETTITASGFSDMFLVHYAP